MCTVQYTKVYIKINTLIIICPGTSKVGAEQKSMAANVYSNESVIEW